MLTNWEPCRSSCGDPADYWDPWLAAGAAHEWLCFYSLLCSFSRCVGLVSSWERCCYWSYRFPSAGAAPWSVPADAAAAAVAGLVDYPIWKHFLQEEASCSLIRVSRLSLRIQPMRKCFPLKQFGLCSAGSQIGSRDCFHLSVNYVKGLSAHRWLVCLWFPSWFDYFMAFVTCKDCCLRCSQCSKAAESFESYCW